MSRNRRHHSGGGGSQHRLTAADGADRPGQLEGVDVLEQVAVGAGPYGGDHLVFGDEAGEDEDPGGRSVAAQPADGLDTVDLWHDQVEEQHVGLGSNGHPNRFGAVLGFAHHLESLARLEEGPQPAPDHGVVVGDHDSDGSFSHDSPRAAPVSPSPGPIQRQRPPRRSALPHRGEAESAAADGGCVQVEPDPVVAHFGDQDRLGWR